MSTMLDQMINLTWHLPIPQDFACKVEKHFTSLHQSQELYLDDVLKSEIYNLIHHTDNAEVFMSIFIDRLSDDINSTDVLVDLSGTDIYDIDMLFTFVNKYIMYIIKVPMG
jgi:hypothetical protein